MTMKKKKNRQIHSKAELAWFIRYGKGGPWVLLQGWSRMTGRIVLHQQQQHKGI